MTNKILIAEDDETLGSILAEKIKRSGYETFLAKNGQEALDILVAEKPDLLLLDILMPIKNGMEVLEEMHEKGYIKKVPVIVISNSGQPVEIERAKELGVEDFLIKTSFDPEDVLEKVANVLKKYGK